MQIPHRLKHFPERGELGLRVGGVMGGLDLPHRTRPVVLCIHSLKPKRGLRVTAAPL